MNYIVFSDVHNNYFALNCFYNYLKNQEKKYREIFFLGDLIGYYKFDLRLAKVMDKLGLEYKLTSCIGNHDFAFLDYLINPRYKKYESKSIENTIKDNIQHSGDITNILGQSNTEIIDTNINGKRHILCHGGMNDFINEYCYPDMKFVDKGIGKFSKNTNYIFGHTHRPFIKKIGNNTFVNVGSLGMPRDGDPRLSFLEINGCNYTIKRLFYDQDKLYEYNINLEDETKNRIYTGGKTKFNEYKLLDLKSESQHVNRVFKRVYTYKRSIYIQYKERLYSIYKIEESENVIYVLKTKEKECYIKDISDIIRRIKNEQI